MLFFDDQRACSLRTSWSYYCISLFFKSNVTFCNKWIDEWIQFSVKRNTLLNFNIVDKKSFHSNKFNIIPHCCQAVDTGDGKAKFDDSNRFEEQIVRISRWPVMSKKYIFLRHVARVLTARFISTPTYSYFMKFVWLHGYKKCVMNMNTISGFTILKIKQRGKNGPIVN